jgi:hypothetical protein
MMNNLKDKLSNLKSDKPSQWLEKAQYRKDNRDVLMKQAIDTLNRLEEKRAKINKAT